MYKVIRSSSLAVALMGAVFLTVNTAAETQLAKSVEVTNESFNCLFEMTPVRGFFVDNLLGDIEATVAVAESKDGGKYPVGSVVQLVPEEVMVKHPEGTRPNTNDWEFFELSVSKSGTEIDKRGFEEVNNKFGLNCLDCHIKAEAKWDLICETGHGCDPLPLTRSMIDVIQKLDQRCEPRPLTDEEKAIAAQLQQMFGSNDR